MGRHCFILGCKANKWRKRHTHTKSTAFFGFPKSKTQFEEWKKSIPRRTAFQREPTEQDHLCSLHFKNVDVIKYYEYNSFKGLPKNQIVRLERGTWTLKRNAVPCYFDNDNPDEKQLIRTIKARETKKSLKSNESSDLVGCSNDEEGTTGLDVYDCPDQVVSVTMDNSSTANECNMEDHIQLQEYDMQESPQLSSQVHEPTAEESVDDACTGLTRTAMLDHCYHLPITNSEETSSPQTIKTKLKYDPYTVEQLHQDVLDVVLPKKWAFFQNDDDYVTAFLLYNDDMTVNRSVKFPGSCRPYVTVNNSVMQHRRINSKEEIQELLLCVSVM